MGYWDALSDVDWDEACGNGHIWAPDPTPEPACFACHGVLDPGTPVVLVVNPPAVWVVHPACLPTFRERYPHADRDIYVQATIDEPDPEASDAPLEVGQTVGIWCCVCDREHRQREAVTVTWDRDFEACIAHNRCVRHCPRAECPDATQLELVIRGSATADGGAG
jgi:hypothetical protein